MAPKIPDEPWHAVQARFGTVEFWAQRTSDSAPRRIAEYRRAFADGADTEDMGADARQTPVGALLSLSQVKALQALRDARAVRTYRDPTMGSYSARLIDVVPNWNAAGPMNLYATDLTFKAHGIAAPAASATSAAAGAAAARATAAIFAGDLDGLDDIPDFDLPSDSSTTTDAFNSAWADFDGLLAGELGGDTSAGGGSGAGLLGRSLGVLSSAVDDVVNMVESAVDASVDLAAGYVDTLLDLRAHGDKLLGSCMDVVDSIADADAGATWASVLIPVDQDLSTLLARELGDVSDAVVAAVMERHTSGSALDPFHLAAGLQLEIPVIFDVLAA